VAFAFVKMRFAANHLVNVSFNRVYRKANTPLVNKAGIILTKQEKSLLFWAKYRGGGIGFFFI
jgi:hypothetical protein